MAVAGATPEEFGLKVRAHPSTLIVTARNKMGSGERITVQLGLDKQFIETATLRNDTTALARNRIAARDFSLALAKYGKPIGDSKRATNGWLLGEVPAPLVREFLASFVNAPASVLTDPVPVARYIEDREDAELGLWDVLFASLREDGARVPDMTLGVPIVCQRRTAGDRTDQNTLYISNKQRVASRGIEKTGLSQTAIDGAEAAYRRSEGAADGTLLNYPDRIYRPTRPRALLVIHLLDIMPSLVKKTPVYEEAVVAWSISFPESQHPQMRVDYVVTTTWMRENFRDEFDDEETEAELV